MNKKNLILILVLVFQLILQVVPAYAVHAAVSNEKNVVIKSKGNIVFGNNTKDISDDVIFCTGDLKYLTEQMDVLEVICR